MLEEDERSRAQWQVLEALLFFASFSDGSLGERILALPPRAFARAADYMDAIGWLRPGPHDGA
jgi:hypothetical protein